MAFKHYRPHIARTLEVLLGLSFVASALSKAYSPAVLNAFAVQIRSYHVLAAPQYLAAAALATVSIELVLAVALLAGFRPRLVTYGLLQGMLVVFTVLIVYAWAFHDLEDCGCFGALEISPGVSILKNILSIAIGGLAWSLYPRAEAVQPPKTQMTYVRGAIAMLCGLGMLAYSFGNLDPIVAIERGEAGPAPSPNGQGPERPYAPFIFDTERGHFDLGAGDYLVAVLNADCEVCMSKVPELNLLYVMPELPPLVALCLEEFEGALDGFRLETGAEFPILSLGNRPLLYFALRGDEEVRFSHIRNGVHVRHWDGVVPDYETLIEALADS